MILAEKRSIWRESSRKEEANNLFLATRERCLRGIEPYQGTRYEENRLTSDRFQSTVRFTQALPGEPSNRVGDGAGSGIRTHEGVTPNGCHVNRRILPDGISRPWL